MRCETVLYTYYTYTHTHTYICTYKKKLESDITSRNELTLLELKSAAEYHRTVIQWNSSTNDQVIALCVRTRNKTTIRYNIGVSDYSVIGR